MEGQEDIEFEFDIEGVDSIDDIIFDEEGKMSVQTNDDTKSSDTKEKEEQVIEEFTFSAPEGPETDEKETEGKEVTGENKPSEGGASPSPSNNDFVSSFASALHKDGVITGLDDEKLKGIDSLSKLTEAIRDTIKENEFSDLDDKGKKVLEAIRNGVPIESIAKHHNTEIQLEQFTEDKFTESPEDTEDVLEYKKEVRRNIIFNDMRVRGYTEDQAKRKVDASIASGDDVEDAKIAIENLRKVASEKKQHEFENAQRQKEEYEQRRNELKEDILKTEEIIPGLKVSDSVRKQIAEALTVPTGRTEDGRLRTVVSDKRSENPTSFDTKLNYFIALGLFDEKPDLSVFSGQKITSAVKELEKNLDNQGFYKEGRGTSLDSVLEAEQKNIDLSLLDYTDF